MSVWITCERCGSTADGQIGRHVVMLVVGGREHQPRTEYCLDCGDALLDALEEFGATERAARPETRAETRERHAASRGRDAAWRATAGEQRQRLILEALRSDRLSVGQIAARLTERHRDEFGRIFASGLRNEVRKMLDRGELERERDDHRNKQRYVYFRKVGLSGPIAELEAQIRNESEA